MPQEIITLEDLHKFRLQLLEDLKQFIAKGKQSQNEWLRSAEVRKMLKISHGTLQNLRVNGAIPYRKLGGIMYYKYEDILKMLERERHYQ